MLSPNLISLIIIHDNRFNLNSLLPIQSPIQSIHLSLHVQMFTCSLVHLIQIEHSLSQICFCCYCFFYCFLHIFKIEASHHHAGSGVTAPNHNSNHYNRSKLTNTMSCMFKTFPKYLLFSDSMFFLYSYILILLC